MVFETINGLTVLRRLTILTATKGGLSVENMRTRAQGETVQLTKVRILERTRAKLEKEAQAERTTINAILRSWLERQEQETDALGGPRVAALLRTLAALIKRGDDSWLDDPDLFNTVTARWSEHLDAIRPPRARSDQAQIQEEFAEVRRCVERAVTPEERRAWRRIAKRIAETGYALDPAMRARYAALAGEEESE